MWNTNMAASTGVLGWTTYHYIFKGRKFTVIGACEGAIAGLVGITPAAGYVNPWYAAIIGFVTAIVCCVTGKINELLRIDDGLEVFKLHAIGGMCGAFLTGTSKLRTRISFCRLAVLLKFMPTWLKHRLATAAFETLQKLTLSLHT